MSASTLSAPAAALVAGHADAARCLERVCPLCGQDNHGQPPSTLSRGTWRLKQCRGCAFVYLENALRYEELSVNHAWSKSRLAEKQFRADANSWREPAVRPMRAIRTWLRRLLPRRKAARLIEQYVRSGQVLEVGCGSGQMLRRLPEHLVPCGIEIDARAAAKARKHIEPRGGLLLHADGLGGLTSLEDASMSGVLMHSYLEHENQPLEVLQQTARVLVPGGVVVIKVPNFASFNRHLLGRVWPGFRFPDHVNYFTPESLQAIVSAAGLKILRCSWLDRLPTSDSLWLVGQASG
ncbi:MAG TPA: class I SAM-dependent methyltransferase [Pirellulaceae bacterium]|nr:class I SAM-dependent methyltransferase [Pirellulaceae bacterium]